MGLLSLSYTAPSSLGSCAGDHRQSAHASLAV
ncbi:Uncharacterised protein [Vibrio cholerae]|nr:Uncharacterised protein [Vibrio cholerae]